MVYEARLKVGPAPGVAPHIPAQELVVAAVSVQEAGKMARARQLAKLTLAPQLQKLTGPAPASLALERRQNMPGALRRKRGDGITYRVSARRRTGPLYAPRCKTTTLNHILPPLKGHFR